MKDLSKLISILKDGRVFIQTHNYPDPDAVASAYGLQKLLEKFDIEATICYCGGADGISVNSMLSNLPINIVPGAELDMSPDDKIVVVDVQMRNSNMEDLPGDEVACIDHHPNEHKYDYLYEHIEEVGACSSLIAQYYFDNGFIPDNDVSSALVYGIKMDTDGFSRGVTELDVEMYYKLFRYANNQLIDRMELNTMQLSDLKAYGHVIENICVANNVGYAYIPFICPDSLVAMISDFILAVNTIEVSVVYAKRGSGYKFSVRSELPELHAGNIIREALSAYTKCGGHARMAGGFVDGSKLPQAEDVRDGKIHDLFDKTISEHRKSCEAVQ